MDRLAKGRNRVPHGAAGEREWTGIDRLFFSCLHDQFRCKKTKEGLNFQHVIGELHVKLSQLRELNGAAQRESCNYHLHLGVRDRLQFGTCNRSIVA